MGSVELWSQDSGVGSEPSEPTPHGAVVWGQGNWGSYPLGSGWHPGGLLGGILSLCSQDGSTGQVVSSIFLRGKGVLGPSTRGFAPIARPEQPEEKAPVLPGCLLHPICDWRIAFAQGQVMLTHEGGEGGHPDVVLSGWVWSCSMAFDLGQVPLLPCALASPAIDGVVIVPVW